MQRSSSQRWRALGSRRWQTLLILCGDDDPIVPTINAKIMHQLIPHSKLHIFRGGHLGLVVKAKELSHNIGQFLMAN
jgi:pimeloyl-ACP methyl ester carboxylesterase